MANEENRTFRISGLVLDRNSQQGGRHLQIEVWDKDLIYNDVVGSTTTNEQGVFQIEFAAAAFWALFLGRQPNLFFKVFQENRLIKSTEEELWWNIEVEGTLMVIQVEIPDTEVPVVWLTINSFDELLQHEGEILEHIANTPNGGNLFMTHPFMLLADIGVVLSKQVVEDIIRHEPALTGLSPTPYYALKASKAPQSVRFRIHGLFQRRLQ